MDDSIRLISGQISLLSGNGSDSLFRSEIGLFSLFLIFSLFYTQSLLKSLIIAICSIVGVAIVLLLLVEVTQNVTAGDLLKSYRIGFASSLFVAALTNLTVAITSRKPRYRKPKEESVKPLSSYRK